MYYGTPTPVNQVATIGVPDPTLITVQPWDPTLMEAVEKAVRSSDFGFNPINDGRVIKVPIPPLDEERRKELAKKVSKMLEEEKTALRNMRRESKEYIEKTWKRTRRLQKTTSFRGWKNCRSCWTSISSRLRK